MGYCVKNEGKEIRLYEFKDLSDDVKQKLIHEKIAEMNKFIMVGVEDLDIFEYMDRALDYLTDLSNGIVYDIDGHAYYLDMWDVVLTR